MGCYNFNTYVYKVNYMNNCCKKYINDNYYKLINGKTNYIVKCYLCDRYWNIPINKINKDGCGANVKNEKDLWLSRRWLIE